MTAGRPTKYHEKYCEELISFMEKTSHEIVVDRNFYDAKWKWQIVNWIEVWALKSETHKVFACTFPTLERFCHSIWIHKDTLIEWATAKYPEDYKDKKLAWELKHPEFSDAYKRAKQIQESILVENALSWQYNPQFSIFIAKNAFWWKDKSEVENSWEMTVKKIIVWLPNDEE